MTPKDQILNRACEIELEVGRVFAMHQRNNLNDLSLCNIVGGSWDGK
jgi:hypothetical protein